MHLAMYDAHAGVVGGAGLPRYLTGAGTPTAGGGADAAAAVAMAAYTTLTVLFPRQKPHFDTAMANAGLNGPGVNAGVTFGQAVGNAVLADRGADTGAGDAGYVASNARFRHRPDPVTAQTGVHGPFYGNNKCFAVSARHDLNDPLASMSQYIRAVKQVRSKGIAPELAGTLPFTSEKRTPEETLIGIYWAYDGPRGLGTPPRLYNQIVRQVAIEKNNNANQNARLFALVNAAMGDAGILAWEQKYRWDLWRPVVGIREHDPSMGPAPSATVSAMDPECDPEWKPLGAPGSNGTGPDFTPPFPAYPSGHATFGAAALHMTRLFYGVAPGNRKKDSLIDGAFVSQECDGIARDSKGAIRAAHARKFDGGLWQMIEENGFSRVFLGVHWFLDAFALKPGKDEPDYSKTKIGGVNLGLAIAEDIWAVGGQKGPKKSKV